MARQRREIASTRFVDGFAEGWVFGVSESFKDALDIRNTPRVLGRNSPLTKELQRRGIDVPDSAMSGDPTGLTHLQRALRNAGILVIDWQIEKTETGKTRVVLIIETQGVPGAFAFSAGDIMHDPPKAHQLKWDQALEVLRRSVQIEAASNSSYSQADGAVTAGEVKAVLRHYRDGKLMGTDNIVCTQLEFVKLLRDGYGFNVALSSRASDRSRQNHPTKRSPGAPRQ